MYRFGEELAKTGVFLDGEGGGGVSLKRIVCEMPRRHWTPTGVSVGQVPGSLEFWRAEAENINWVVIGTQVHLQG